MITAETKEIERKLKSPLGSIDKDLRALEKRITMKLSKALNKFGEVSEYSDLINFLKDLEEARQTSEKLSQRCKRVENYQSVAL